MVKRLLFILCLNYNIAAICVHESTINGLGLLSNYNDFVKAKLLVAVNDQYIPLKELKNINPYAFYEVQVDPTKKISNYNDRYIEYYRYARIQDYLKEKKDTLKDIGYYIETVGKSIEGRELYSVFPRFLDFNKKTILMFGRHHGDEGTANWIIEGFVNRFLDSPEMQARFNLILYPMVNPDGAENRVRYNKNRRDLNRVWYRNSDKSKDEVKLIQKHLEDNFLKLSARPIIVLDMHGSFTEDFIYRVDKNFINQDFYNIQQLFIDELAPKDPWQNGNFQISNGHPQMARIRFVNDYKMNALTHETPRDISKRSGRTKLDLMGQGNAVAESLLSLY